MEIKTSCRCEFRKILKGQLASQSLFLSDIEIFKVGKTIMDILSRYSLKSCSTEKIYLLVAGIFIGCRHVGGGPIMLKC